jgi:hypothetical protein
LYYFFLKNKKYNTTVQHSIRIKTLKSHDFVTQKIVGTNVFTNVS